MPGRSARRSSRDSSGSSGHVGARSIVPRRTPAVSSCKRVPAVADAISARSPSTSPAPRRSTSSRSAHGPPKGAGDGARRVADLRLAIVAALRARALGLPFAEPSRTKKLWTPRFFVRRAAWHVLDHAWEIEDRAIRRDLLAVAPLRAPKGKRRPSELVNEGRGR